MSRKRAPRRRLVAYALGALLAGVLGMQGWYYLHVLWWVSHDPARTAFMERRLEQLRAHDPRARLQQQWVPYDRISVYLKRAVVASEDAKFLEHAGFDWEAIEKAAEENERKGRIVAGASTISQQLARNLFLSGERSWLRKGEEAVITSMLESAMSKRRILELYLNVAEWGPDGVFGAEAAARHHFGVSAAALNREQAAWLAAILPSPRRYDRGRMTRYLARRIAVILARMPAARIPSARARYGTAGASLARIARP
ncbi:MAG: monofunctional biosynthetic peptidoglycan transglycosylase [Betaproteobacteria bacterium]|nr:monofunctional biosynthetic peptidoglycan transglycosylase [Betaproteobacteria bacterium]